MFCQLQSTSPPVNPSVCERTLAVVTKADMAPEGLPMLSLIDEDIVGIPVIAQKLMLIQATMISRCLPEKH